MKSIVALKVKPRRQNYEKGLLGIFQGIGSGLLLIGETQVSQHV